MIASPERAQWHINNIRNLFGFNREKQARYQARLSRHQKKIELVRNYIDKPSEVA